MLATAFVIFSSYQEASKRKQARIEGAIERESYADNSMNIFRESKGANCFATKYNASFYLRLGENSLQDMRDIGYESFFCPDISKKKLIYQCNYFAFLDQGSFSSYDDRPIEYPSSFIGDFDWNEPSETDYSQKEIVDNFSTFIEITPFSDNENEDVFVEAHLISIFSPWKSRDLLSQSAFVTFINKSFFGVISGQTNKERKFINFGNNYDLELFMDRTNLTLSGRFPRIRNSSYNSPCGGLAEPKCQDELQVSKCSPIDEDNYILSLRETINKIDASVTSFRQLKKAEKDLLDEEDIKIKDNFKL